jgi:2'-5' RNA ligase
MSIRTFISVDIEDPNVLSKIKLVKNSLSSLGADLKLVEDENLHLTLVFIGEVPEPQITVIKHALQEVKRKPFRIHLYGAGCFPTCNRPRVLWIGTKEGSEEMTQLYKKITSSLRKEKISFEEEKDYTPHLTIARVRSNKNIGKIAKLLEALIDEDFGWIEVKEFRLKKSTLTPKGPIYETLASFSLSE